MTGGGELGALKFVVGDAGDGVPTNCEGGGVDWESLVFGAGFLVRLGAEAGLAGFGFAVEGCGWGAGVSGG